MDKKRINVKYGMVGGGMSAMIGEYHRKALSSMEAVLAAGCFSSQSQKNRQTGEELHIQVDRVYDNYREMAEREGEREDGIDFVVIAAPNNIHFEAAKVFLKHGIHVMCEKPLCFTVKEGEELKKLTEENRLYFGVAYTYVGYDMVRLAKKIVSEGEIGEILNVTGQFWQNWMLDVLKNPRKIPWRTESEKSGISNCVGDIGTHIEAVISYILGMYPKRVSAVLDRYGMELDVNGNILVEYENGLHGVFSCSQVYGGMREGLGISICGMEGCIEWSLGNANTLTVMKCGHKPDIYRWLDGKIVKDEGMESEKVEFKEGMIHAFSNIYYNFAKCIVKQKRGEKVTVMDRDFPSVNEGIVGVKFIHAAIESDKNHSVWIDL